MPGTESMVLEVLNPTEDLCRSSCWGDFDIPNQRTLAIVSNKDEETEFEEGCVFVLKGQHDQSAGLEVERVIPISNGFSISMAQAKLPTVHFQSPTVTNSLHEQPRSGFNVTIELREASQTESSSFFTSDIQSLRSVLGECRRLREPSEPGSASNFQATPGFKWLLPYIAQNASAPGFPLVPRDLRHAVRPFHERLSSASAGFPGNGISDIHLLRDEWIHTRARSRACRGKHGLRIRVGSFNVNGQLPSQDLSVWVRGSRPAAGNPIIPPLKQVSPLSLGEVASDPLEKVQAPAGTGETKNDRAPSLASVSTLVNPTDPSDASQTDMDPDVFVLGFQELDLSTEALIYSTSTTREDAWCMAVFASLGEKAIMYEKVASRQLVGILIVAIVKKSLKSRFTNAQTCAAGAGILGIMGNKGATAMRMEFRPPLDDDADIESVAPISLTFVNSHLAAFDEMFEKRNSDFQDLSKRLVFGSGSVQARDSELDSVSAPIQVYECDALFWMVNLNYRLNLPDGHVRDILSSEQWDNKYDTLLKYDQVFQVLLGARFHMASHCSTYRFSPGIPRDKMGYDTKRKPAWTDRILHLVNPTTGLCQMSYSGFPEITMSDHRPVGADFHLTTDILHIGLYEAEARHLHEKIGPMGGASQARPSLKIDNPSVDLGTVRYKRRVSRTLNLENTGDIPCAYRFVPLQLNSPIHPEWLEVSPIAGIILPGEAGVVDITAFVDNHAASRLNVSGRELDVTLILHTMLGKDHFISVTGKYDYTCFANTVSRLVRLPGPIRSLDSPKDLLPVANAVNAPREIMRLIKWMMANTTLAVEGVISEIRETAEASICRAYGSTLLQLLESLAEPIVPVSLHPQCAQMTSRDEAFELLEEFPAASVNIWISLTAFLHFVGQTSKDANKVFHIATTFAPVLLKSDPYTLSPTSITLHDKRDFLMFFIG
ncbi:Endonuclease/exonuclease/phosphatase [Infundibulicybe gibba]|nr:Endonuclease/exonuclease/phosphatase [Infundibulicybe gibba]